MRPKVLALAAWLRDGRQLFHGLMDAVDDDTGLTWAAEVAALCAKHGVVLYPSGPDVSLFCELSATLAELDEAEERRREAKQPGATDPAPRLQPAGELGGGPEL